jgi:small subunit ribosomal protein S1
MSSSRCRTASKDLAGGTRFDFDQYYEQELRQIILGAGMVPVRADSICGPQSVLTAVWRGLQQAEIMVITGRRDRRTWR